MRFSETLLKGAFVIYLDPVQDERGFFSRVFCQNEFAMQGLRSTFVQSNQSGSLLSGTIRGLHYQISPHDEVKLVRCVKGAVFDVMVDIRKDSPTFLQWFGQELTENNDTMLYIPQGFAHGFQTLVDNSHIFYMVSNFYTPDYEQTIRYNDSKIDVRWPLPVSNISQKDTSAPLISETFAGIIPSAST
jgi:dTDP-4-dehydrorhamnose 3,5-epimerase